MAIIVPAMALAHSANSAMITAMMKDEKSSFLIQPPFPQSGLGFKKIMSERFARAKIVKRLMLSVKALHETIIILSKKFKKCNKKNLFNISQYFYKYFKNQKFY